jgi:hypothetical protein
MRVLTLAPLAYHGMVRIEMGLRRGGRLPLRMIIESVGAMIAS